MNFFDRPQTLLEDRISDWSRGNHFFRKSFVAVLTIVLFGFNAEVHSESIKLGYAALSATQVAAWMAKEGGYLSKYGIEAEYIYIPAVAATQALIAGDSTGSSDRGLYFRGDPSRGRCEDRGQLAQPHCWLDLRPAGNQDTGRSQRKKNLAYRDSAL